MAKGTHRVAGLRGAVVRAGIELDSEVVGELDHGAVLSAVSHCTSRSGVERVLISAPLSGWCTLRVLEPLDGPDVSAAAKEGTASATPPSRPDSFQSFVIARQRQRDELRPTLPPSPLSPPDALVLADSAAAAQNCRSSSEVLLLNGLARPSTSRRPAVACRRATMRGASALNSARREWLATRAHHYDREPVHVGSPGRPGEQGRERRHAQPTTGGLTLRNARDDAPPLAVARRRLEDVSERARTPGTQVRARSLRAAQAELGAWRVRAARARFHRPRASVRDMEGWGACPVRGPPTASRRGRAARAPTRSSRRRPPRGLRFVNLHLAAAADGGRRASGRPPRGGSR